MDLIGLFKDQLTDAAMDKISGMVGSSDKGAITKGLMSAAPALLGGLMSKASDKKGISGIWDLLGDSSIGDMNSGGGASLVKMILGDKASGIIDMVSSVSGLEGGAANKLLSLAGSLFGGILGKQKADGMDLGGFVGMLGNQGSILEKFAPAGLAGILGLGSLSGLGSNLAKGALEFASGAADTGKAVVGSAANAAENIASGAGDLAGDAVKAGGSMLGKILKFAIPIVLVLAAFYFLRGCNEGKSITDSAKGAVSSTVGAVKDGADVVGDAAGNVANTVGDAAGNAANATGDAIKDGASAVESAAGKTFNFAKDVAGGVVNATGDIVNAAGNAIGKFFSWVLPNGTKLNIPENGFEANFLDYLKNGKLETGKYYDFDRLYFDPASAELNENSMDQLDNVAKILKAYPNMNVLLRGHTDNTGSANANIELSATRAASVKASLVFKGIDANRISTKGMGQSSPIANNETEVGKQRNRRIDISIAK